MCTKGQSRKSLVQYVWTGHKAACGFLKLYSEVDNDTRRIKRKPWEKKTMHRRGERQEMRSARSAAVRADKPITSRQGQWADCRRLVLSSGVGSHVLFARLRYQNLGYAIINVANLQDFDLTGPDGSLLSEGSVAIGAVFLSLNMAYTREGKGQRRGGGQLRTSFVWRL